MDKKLCLMITGCAVLVAAGIGFIWINEKRRPDGPQILSAKDSGPTPRPTSSRTPVSIPPFHIAEATSDLPPTLEPAIFNGSMRAGYQIAKEIPEILAQLPCYCRCDRSVGHRSLHACFVDDHGSSCGICQNEAMTAYKLRKEKNLDAVHIREKIIEQYSRQY